jgi:hypothetical protein
MVAVARLFRDVIDGRIAGDEASRTLAEIYPGVPFANGFMHGAPGFMHARSGTAADTIRRAD